MVGWYIYEVICNLFLLGLVGLVEVLLFFYVVLFVGYLVDYLLCCWLGMVVVSGLVLMVVVLIVVV